MIRFPSAVRSIRSWLLISQNRKSDSSSNSITGEVCTMRGGASSSSMALTMSLESQRIMLIARRRFGRGSFRIIEWHLLTATPLFDALPVVKICNLLGIVGADGGIDLSGRQPDISGSDPAGRDQAKTM